MRTVQQIVDDLEIRIINPQLKRAGYEPDVEKEEVGIDPRYARKFVIHDAERGHVEESEHEKLLNL